MNGKQKILLVAPYNSGTIAACSLNLWKVLSEKLNYDVKCVVKHRFENGFPEFDQCEYYSDHAPKGGLKNITTIVSQIKWLRNIKQNFNPDQTISTLTSCSALNVLSGGKDLKTGIFHSPHYQAKMKGKVTYTFALLYYKFLFPHLDRLFCVSKEVKESIIKSFPQIPASKVTVVYNAHNVNDIKSKANESLDSSEEDELFNKPIFLYVGRFDNNKAPERAVSSFAEAFSNSDEQLVFIGGDNRYQEKVKLIAQQLKVIDRVHFLGRKINPYKYIARAKALISCSYSEGLPGVIIESSILGVPVVSTNSSVGVWEILSCDYDYNPNMTNNYISPYGIITPNNLTEKENIHCLAQALKDICSKNSHLTKPNPFVDKVSFDSVSQFFK